MRQTFAAAAGNDGRSDLIRRRRRALLPSDAVIRDTDTEDDHPFVAGRDQLEIEGRS